MNSCIWQQPLTCWARILSSDTTHKDTNSGITACSGLSGLSCSQPLSLFIKFRDSDQQHQPAYQDMLKLHCIYFVCYSTHSSVPHQAVYWRIRSPSRLVQNLEGNSFAATDIYAGMPVVFTLSRLVRSNKPLTYKEFNNTV